MKKITKINQSGAGHILLFGFILFVAVAAFAGYKVMNSKKTSTDNNSNNTSKTSTTTSSTTAKTDWPINDKITWEADGRGGWISMPYDTKPPACPDPVQLNLPVTDSSIITSILYPGQTRQGTFTGQGGNYKPHGAFRFDNKTDNNVDVVMPFNGSVFRANRFTESGEIQYDFDIVNSCGIMIRVGHLRELTPAFQAIADKLPAATAGDSRTTKVLPMVPFKTGDKIATVIGFKNTKNVTFDYGVYDLRSNNEASKDASYKTAHADTGELAYHGLCWLDLLDDKDSKVVKALPGGDKVAGKTSDYCK